MTDSGLVVAGGTGDAADVAAVEAATRPLPVPVKSLFDRKKARIVACRGSVTDFETSLRGVVPRGWEGLGRTWDDVPGTYLHDRKRVVIATGASAAGRAVPERGPESHGSIDLVLHESMHGFDYLGKHRVLRDARFVAARAADWNALGDYERQDGRAGLEETFAESASRFFLDDPTMRRDWPNLLAYWRTAFDEAPRERPVPLPPARRSGAVGTFQIPADRAISLDLRAEGPGGAIGHAALLFRPGEPGHSRLSEHLSRREEATGGAALFYPLEPTDP